MSKVIYEILSVSGAVAFQILGLSIVVFLVVWVCSKILVSTLKYIGGWRIFIEYALNRKLFLKWKDEQLKNDKNKEI